MSDPIMHPEDFNWLCRCPVCNIEQTWSFKNTYRAMYSADYGVQGDKCGHVQTYQLMKANGGYAEKGTQWTKNQC